MSIDPYASCPCGSGKKFKWCCQSIFAAIQHAWQQENNGQHDAALRIMDQLVQEHPTNPEAWGQKANLLFAHQRPEQAEEALEKAFAINPNYPFGLRLRAKARYAEGEIQGALLLARRAAEAYDPAAHDALAELYSLIFDGEMRCNRPVAARAALERACHLDPANDNLRNVMEQAFGENGRLPLAARKAYEFRKAAGGASAERRQAWARVLGGLGTRLSEVAAGFETLTKQDPADAPAWFNLGLTRAWLGDNPAAVQALDRYIELETNDSAAVEAAALSEVLRFGLGMQEQSDYQEYTLLLQFTNPQPVQALVDDWGRQGRIIALPNNQEGVFTGMILELNSTGLVTVGKPVADSGRMGSYMVIAGQLLRFHSPLKEPFGRLREELRQKLNLGLNDLRVFVGPANFHEVLSEALVFPIGAVNQAEWTKRILDNANRFFENTWMQRPRKSLDGLSPATAARQPVGRRKLLGVLELMQEAARGGALENYDFNDLRRKLGLGEAEAKPQPQQSEPAQDIAAMSAAELASLDLKALSNDDLEKAYQTAYRLDAQDLAGLFASTLIDRPVQADRTDRYPWYAFLIQKALREGAHDAALDHVNKGEQADSEQNQGKRNNDYEMFRARVHGKRGEADQAEAVYQQLIDRVPRDFKVRGKAAEEMLALKQPARALKFAEEGVQAARQANDRESENYLAELAEAAKRQMG